MVFASGYCMARLQATCANSKADLSGVGNVKCRPAFGSTAQKTLAVPHRSYSLSCRASRPGLAREEGRTSACSVTGFSSRLFFFQAEDGIRYYKVTGVQTCALPI